jgi:hypothetical protein
LTSRFQLTIDCQNPHVLVQFWCEALGYVAEDPPPGFADWRTYWQSIGETMPDDDNGVDSIVDPEGNGPRIWFQKVPERKNTKNRLHLDLLVSGPSATCSAKQREALVLAKVARLGELRASVLNQLEGAGGPQHFAVVMADPEGNEFCVT